MADDIDKKIIDGKERIRKMRDPKTINRINYAFTMDEIEEFIDELKACKENQESAFESVEENAIKGEKK